MKNETIIKMIMWVWDGVDPAKHVISAHNIKHNMKHIMKHNIKLIIRNVINLII